MENGNAHISLIDVHTHLHFLEEEPQEIIKRCKQKGIERLINVGTNPDDHHVVLELANRWGPSVYCSLGVHPHEAHRYNFSVENHLRVKAKEEKVVAIGEIGLDYYYEESARDVQKQAFRAQLELAAEVGLPVEIHSRDAEEDTISILQEFRGQIKGLMHCFTGSSWLAEESLKLGMDISLSGVVTFKNAEPLRELTKKIPLNRLHVETDAPYLAPVPQRGKKNEPSFLFHTAQFVADLKGVSLSQLSTHLQQNAQKLFAKLIW